MGQQVGSGDNANSLSSFELPYALILDCFARHARIMQLLARSECALVWDGVEQLRLDWQSVAANSALNVIVWPTSACMLEMSAYLRDSCHLHLDVSDTILAPAKAITPVTSKRMGDSTAPDASNSPALLDNCMEDLAAHIPEIFRGSEF